MKEMKGIKSMLLEMKVELETAIVYSDNQGAIKIAKNTTSAGRMLLYYRRCALNKIVCYLFLCIVSLDR